MISLVEVQQRLSEHCRGFVLNENLFFRVQDHYKKKINYSKDYIEEDSLILVLKFLKNENQSAYYWLKEIRERQKKMKRQYSTTHRIEIAYRTKYKCAMCKLLLPPTFEIDHIKELWEGGKDEYNNLQALCPNCHALKTRANKLKLDDRFKREFSKRAREYEHNAFEQFKFKKSRYF